MNKLSLRTLFYGSEIHPAAQQKEIATPLFCVNTAKSLLAQLSARLRNFPYTSRFIKDRPTVSFNDLSSSRNPLIYLAVVKVFTGDN